MVRVLVALTEHSGLEMRPHFSASGGRLKRKGRRPARARVDDQREAERLGDFLLKPQSRDHREDAQLNVEHPGKRRIAAQRRAPRRLA